MALADSKPLWQAIRDGDEIADPFVRRKVEAKMSGAKTPTARLPGQGPDLAERAAGLAFGGPLGAMFPRQAAGIAEQAGAGALEMTGRAAEFAGSFGEKAIHAVTDALPEALNPGLTRAEKGRRVHAAREPGQALQAEASKAHAPSGYLQEGARALGGAVPLLAASAINPALGVGAIGATAGAGVEGAYDRVLAETGDENKAVESALLQVPIEGLYLAPLGRIMGRLGKASPKAGSLLRNALDGTISGGLGPGSARVLGEVLHEQITEEERADLADALKRGLSEAGRGALVDVPLFAALSVMAGIRPRNVKPTANEGRPDGPGVLSEKLSDAAPSEAAPPQADRPFNVPIETQRSMEPSVLGVPENLKVPERVVEPISVDVVNSLGPEELSAQVLLHNEAVLKNAAARHREHPVAAALDRPVGDAEPVGRTARDVAEGASPDPVGVAVPTNLGSAIGTTERQHLATPESRKVSGAEDVSASSGPEIISGESAGFKAPARSPSSPPDGGAVEPQGFPWEGEAPKKKAHEATGGVRPMTRLEERDSAAFLRREDVRKELQGMAQEAGQAQRGGEVVTDPLTGERTRLTWAPKSEWWNDRPGNMTEAEVKNLVAKVLVNPKAKLGGSQQDMLGWMLERIRKNIPTREQALEARTAFEAKKAEEKASRLVAPLPDEPGMRGAALSPLTPRKAVAQGPAGPGFDAPETSAERLYSGVVNDLERLVQIEKRAPKKVRSLTGETLEESLSLFPGRKFDSGEKVSERIETPLREIFREGLTTDEAGDFLMATHVNDLKRSDMGMDPADAAKIVQDSLSGPKAAQFKKLQAWNRTANQAALDILESGSLISKETRAAWEKKYGKDFTHLKSIPDDMAKELFGGSGFTVAGPESKARKGRDSKAGNPIAFRLMSIREAISRKERNRVGNLLADLVRQNTKPDFWRIETDRNKVHESEYALSFKEDGEQRFIVTKDKGLVDAFKRIQEPEPGAVALLDPVNKWLHNVIIKWNPVFPLYNVPKDIGTAALKQTMRGDLQGALSTARSSIPAAKGVFAELRKPGSGGAWGTRYRELREAGGVIGWNEQYSFEQQVDAFKKATSPQSKAAAYGKFMDDVNRAAEVGTRLAAFDAFKKAGMPTPKAAMEARRITADFARRGRWAPIYRRLYLFSGANVQGTSEMARAIKANPGKSAGVLGSLIAAGYMNAAASELLGDPKELEKLSEDEKARFFGVMVGKTRIGIPAPYGFNVFPYIGHKLHDIGNGAEPGKALADALSASLDSFSPLPKGANPVQSLTPTAARPFVELGQNKKFSNAPIMPEPSPYDRNPPPDSKRYFSTVSGISREVADGLSNAGIEVSPETLDHLAGAATGGLGQTLLRSYENVRKVIVGDTDGMRPQDIPIAGEALRPFARQAPESAADSLFWSTARRVEETEARVKDGDMKAADAPGEMAAAQTLNALEKPMKALRAAIKKAENEQEREKLKDRLRALQERFLEAARKNGMKLEVR